MEAVTKDYLLNDKANLSIPYQVWQVGMNLRFHYEVPAIFYGTKLKPTEEDVAEHKRVLPKAFKKYE